MRGIKGFVKDEEGNPLENVKILVSDRKHDVTTYKDGDYWRILLPGTYQISAQMKGYNSAEKIHTVDLEEAKMINFTLTKKPTDMALVKLGHVGLVFVVNMF